MDPYKKPPKFLIGLMKATGQLRDVCKKAKVPVPPTLMFDSKEDLHAFLGALELYDVDEEKVFFFDGYRLDYRPD